MKKNLTPCNVPFQKLLIIDFASAPIIFTVFLEDYLSFLHIWL